MRRVERDLRRQLHAIADQSGARLLMVETTNGGHLRAVFRKGNRIVGQVVPATPSDVRSIRNTALWPAVYCDRRTTMQRLGDAAANVVARLKFGADPDCVAEDAIVDFFRARHVEVIEHSGAVFLAGQFWTINRAGRLITSVHVDLTDLAEQVVTQLSQTEKTDGFLR
jgi:hypothetical protein